MSWLLAYPLATVSAMAFWLGLLALVNPAPRARLLAWLTLPPTSGRAHLAGFDALRGFAAAYIALAHGWLFTHPVFAATRDALPMIAQGAKAVPIFAALSGFLIHRAVLGLRDLDGLRTYAVRRIARILPVFLLALLLALATGRLVALGQDVTLPTLFVADALLLHAIGFPAFANPVAWGLYAEVLFYVIAPFYVILVGRRRALTAAAVVTLLLTILASQVQARPFGLWPYFLGGLLASELAGARGRWPRGLATALILGGGMTLLLDLQGPHLDPFSRLGLVPRNEDGATIGLLLALVGLLAGLARRGWPASLLEAAPLRILGAVSYSLFLLHPLYIALNFPGLGFDMIGQQYDLWRGLPRMPAWYLPFVFFPGMLPWAALSFVLVEKPAILWGRRAAPARAAE